MTNFVQYGKTLTVTAPRTVASGAGVIVGSIFGLAKNAATSGDTGLEVAVEGVFDIAKAAGAVSAGQRIYWDNTAFVVTTVSTGNTHVGVATQAALTGDATARVKLNVSGTNASSRFKSTEQTGTGSAQNVAHGLGVVPSLVMILPSDLTPATLGAYAAVEGTHTTTNVVVTVTSGKKFFVIAFA